MKSSRLMWPHPKRGASQVGLGRIEDDALPSETHPGPDPAPGAGPHEIHLPPYVGRWPPQCDTTILPVTRS